MTRQHKIRDRWWILLLNIGGLKEGGGARVAAAPLLDSKFFFNKYFLAKDSMYLVFFMFILCIFAFEHSELILNYQF